MSKGRIIPRTLELYEIADDLLTKHKLRINYDFRKRSMFGPQFAFCSRVIWPSKDSPFDFSYQYDWVKEEDRPWKDCRPFEDLLNKRNTKAVVRMHSNELNYFDDQYRLPRVSLFAFPSDYNIKNPELWGIISPQEYFSIYEKATESFSNGRIMAQPFLIEKFYFDYDKSDDYYFLPTHEYIQSSGSIGKKQGMAIMPGIISLPQDLFLSQLIDIGHYERFISESKRLKVDKRALSIISLNYQYLCMEQVPLNLMSDKEKQKALRKAKKDGVLINYIKSINN